MAGSRRQTGAPPKPTRSARRTASWRRQISQAQTSEQLYDSASDWLRAAASRIIDPGQRTAVLNKKAMYLIARAEELSQ
jgi:hypothetical protein